MIPSVVISRLHCGKSLRRGYEIRRRARGASPLFILALNFELFTSFSPTFPELSPLLPAVSALFCHFLYSPRTQSFYFHAIPHSFTKRGGVRTSCKMLFPDPEFFRVRISPIEDQNET